MRSRSMILFMGLFLYLIPQTSVASLSSIQWREITDKSIVNENSRDLAHYKVYFFPIEILTDRLKTITAGDREDNLIDLPSPDGDKQMFKIWSTPLMEPGLAVRYPEIATFTGVAVDNPTVSIKLSLTKQGLHAMVYQGAQTWFIDPLSRDLKDYHQIYYKSNARRADVARMDCLTESLLSDIDYPPAPNAFSNGSVRRSFRLALACTGEYAVAVAGANPDKGTVLSRMVVTINRVNGVFERELAISMQLVANTDTLIFLDPVSDPFNNGNGYALMTENQDVVDERIGSANYDIGHVFSTGGGGVAQMGSVCNYAKKAMGVTGTPNPVGDPFDIDYVAHEIGHQFGADHTFNSKISGCGQANRIAAAAYEPGSGSTIMSYAGLCGADNLQSYVDAYFHSRTLEQIGNFLLTSANCAATTPGSSPPALPQFGATYHIPFLTPFELMIPEQNNVSTYAWEEWDLSNNEFTWVQSRLTAPLFRSFYPDSGSQRVFPEISRIVNNNTSYIGEKLPDTNRVLQFRLTARAVNNGWGSFHFPDDKISLNVVKTIAPFRVSLPGQSSVSWAGGSKQRVNWDVGGTDAMPINCSKVSIYLSVDGGYTFPILVASDLPNTGTAKIRVPNVATTDRARIKVKAQGNVFFDISDENFKIVHDPNQAYPDGVRDIKSGVALNIFPIPAVDKLFIQKDPSAAGQVRIYNLQGQLIWSGEIQDQLEIPVANWHTGVYYLRLYSVDQTPITKTVLIQQ